MTKQPSSPPVSVSFIFSVELLYYRLTGSRSEADSVIMILDLKADFQHGVIFGQRLHAAILGETRSQSDAAFNV